MLQQSLPLYDLDNNYGGSMGKQKKPFLSRLERGLSITQIGFSLGPPIMGFNKTHSQHLPLNWASTQKMQNPIQNVITS